MIYLDTSAFLKTVLAESESAALEAYLDGAPEGALVSSALLSVETRRGVLRTRPARLPRADVALARVNQIGVSSAIIESAARLPDPLLGTLDAIHLATALLIAQDLDAVVTYDARLAEAAWSHGLAVVTPG